MCVRVFGNSSSPTVAMYGLHKENNWDTNTWPTYRGIALLISVGVNTFGPWLVVTRRTRSGVACNKRWVILFKCLSTRAIHIEVVEDVVSFPSGKQLIQIDVWFLQHK